jgi:hypothetical protein
MSALAVEVAYDVMDPAPKILDNRLYSSIIATLSLDEEEVTFILPDLNWGRK